LSKIDFAIDSRDARGKESCWMIFLFCRLRATLLVSKSCIDSAFYPEDIAAAVLVSLGWSDFDWGEFKGYGLSGDMLLLDNSDK
jgi:hypothetical protein